MLYVEENVPVKDPGDAESGPCKLETPGQTQEDKSNLEDHPPRRFIPGGPVSPQGCLVWVRLEGAI